MPANTGDQPIFGMSAVDMLMHPWTMVAPYQFSKDWRRGITEAAPPAERDNVLMKMQRRMFDRHLTLLVRLSPTGSPSPTFFKETIR